MAAVLAVAGIVAVVLVECGPREDSDLKPMTLTQDDIGTGCGGGAGGCCIFADSGILRKRG